VEVSLGSPHALRTTVRAANEPPRSACRSFMCGLAPVPVDIGGLGDSDARVHASVVEVLHRT
jgi:hypothetical protein